MTGPRMTPEQLDAIQARADAATEGPWEHQPYGGQNQNGDYSGGEIFDADGEYVISEVSDEDGAFIAAARTDVPALLAYARDLEAQVKRYAGQDAEAFVKLQVTKSQAKLRAKVADLEARIERVKALHVREVLAVHESHGEEAWCPACRVHWPCPTIAALTATEGQ